MRAAVLLVLALLVTGCSGDDPEASDTTGAGASTSSAPVRSSTTSTSVSTSTSTSVTDTTTSTSSTVPDTTTSTSVAPAPSLDVEAGRIPGLDDSPTLGEAERVFGAAVPVAELPDVFACTGTVDPMAIRAGGLTLVFERAPEQPVDAAVLTNWRYVGGPVGAAPEMTADGRVRVGDARQTVFDVYTSVNDLVTELDVAGLRFGLDGDVVAWFGRVECVFEAAPAEEPASAGATARRGG